MEKRISTRDLAAIKRTAMNVAPIMAKRNKAKEMIEKYTEEYNQHEKTILNYESGIIAQTGLRTEQVVTKVKGVKQTKYIINPNVRFDAETSEYVVTVKDETDNESAPVAEGDKEVAPVEQPVMDEPVAEEVAEQPEEVFENSFQF